MLSSCPTEAVEKTPIGSDLKTSILYRLMDHAKHRCRIEISRVVVLFSLTFTRLKKSTVIFTHKNFTIITRYNDSRGGKIVTRLISFNQRILRNTLVFFFNDESIWEKKSLSRYDEKKRKVRHRCCDVKTMSPRAGKRAAVEYFNEEGDTRTPRAEGTRSNKSSTG